MSTGRRVGSDRHRGKPCVDCGKKKGPNQQVHIRCYRCGLAKRRERRDRAHSRRIEQVYGITGNEYNTLLSFQGRCCAICRRATGLTKRLAVDHDHALAAERGSRASVRGLLCSPCNDTLAHARDDPHFLRRAIDYLTTPPSREVLNLDQPLR
ncbi:endonuclease VII domain-containing protein [Salinispora pacifica]|uniref:endonuclease VII domain-containing protein n=1 Tax=Salinispora pacifica TaxID=351187 RepID=UPI00035DF175|nr:endonuclease VII domain-containing protein [Salinispora pacifica]